MNFEDERYIRLYTRDTATWSLLGWEGQAVVSLLMRKVDRAGVFDLAGLAPADAVVAVIGVPREIVEVGLERLLQRGTLEHRGDALVMPRFMEAQECAQTDAARKRASRERARAEALLKQLDEQSRSRNVSNESRSVTKSHARSQTVTDGHSVPCLALPNQTEIPPPSAGPPRGARSARGPTGHRIPPDWKPGETLRAWAVAEWPSVDLDSVTAEFVDFWLGVSGKAALKVDWDGTFRNRIRELKKRPPVSSVRQTLFRRDVLQPAAKPGEYNWMDHMHEHEPIRE